MRIISYWFGDTYFPLYIPDEYDEYDDYEFDGMFLRITMDLELAGDLRPMTIDEFHKFIDFQKEDPVAYKNKKRIWYGAINSSLSKDILLFNNKKECDNFISDLTKKKYIWT